MCIRSECWQYTRNIILVGGLEHEFYFSLFFHSVGNFIIPTDELHHFSEGWRNHQAGFKILEVKW
jgi:hypothetical protein